MDKLNLTEKEYNFYMKVWHKLKTILDTKIFERIDDLCVYEGDNGSFFCSLSVFKPDRSYTDKYNCGIDSSSLEFIYENISDCDCGFTSTDINCFCKYLFDVLSKVPYLVSRITFNNEMGKSYKGKRSNGEYEVYISVYPKSELEEYFKLPYSIENYHKLISFIDSRDKNQPFNRGSYCPINVINSKARLHAKGKEVSIKSCTEGDALMLIRGCSVGLTKYGSVGSYYTAGNTVVFVGQEVKDIKGVTDKDYFCAPFIEISVSGSTFYGISGGAYNSNGIMFHGKTVGETHYVADKSDGSPDFLSNMCYVKLSDYYNALKEALLECKEMYGLFI